MKIAISVPDSNFEDAERSSEAYVKIYRSAGVQEALAAVYGSGPSPLDPVIDDLQADVLREEW